MQTIECVSERRRPCRFVVESSRAGSVAVASLVLAFGLVAGTPPVTTLVDVNGSFGDAFGGRVTMSQDVLVVTSLFDTIGDVGGQGSAAVFRRSGGAWAFEQELTSSSGGTSEYFGGSVAMDGHAIAVGAAFDDTLGLDAGSVTVFRWDGVAWYEEQELFSSRAAPDDEFGASLALDGDVLVVGSRFADVGGDADRGFATVFRHRDGVWIEEQVLIAEDGEADDLFGWSVDVDGDVIVVGHPFEKVKQESSRGAVTVFRWDGSQWGAEQKLVPSSGTIEGSAGRSVATLGDTIVVGDPFGGADERGVVTVFRRDGVAWQETQALTTTAPLDFTTDDGFGGSLALRDGWLLVGSTREAIDHEEVGGVRAYRWDGAQWGLVHELAPKNGSEADGFGTGLAISGATAVIGASGTDVFEFENQGLVYIYDFGPSPWCAEGDELEGVFGDPCLSGSGPLTAGSVNALELENAFPVEPALLFISTIGAGARFKGGVLRASPPAVPPLVGTTDVNGRIELAFTWPAGVPSQSELWFQYAISDVTTAQGVSLSNALKATTP